MVNDALAGAATIAGQPEDDALAEIFARLALDAGAEIMRVFATHPQMRVGMGHPEGRWFPTRPHERVRMGHL